MPSSCEIIIGVAVYCFVQGAMLGWVTCILYGPERRRRKVPSSYKIHRGMFTGALDRGWGAPRRYHIGDLQWGAPTQEILARLDGMEMSEEVAQALRELCEETGNVVRCLHEDLERKQGFWS